MSDDGGVRNMTGERMGRREYKFKNIMVQYLPVGSYLYQERFL